MYAAPTGCRRRPTGRSLSCTASHRARPEPCTSTASTPSACSPPSHPPPLSACSEAGPAVRPPTGPAHRHAPRRAPSSASSSAVRHTFDLHTLDGATVRATLLELVVRCRSSSTESAGATPTPPSRSWPISPSGTGRAPRTTAAFTWTAASSPSWSPASTRRFGLIEQFLAEHNTTTAKSRDDVRADVMRLTERI